MPTPDKKMQTIARHLCHLTSKATATPANTTTLTSATTPTSTTTLTNTKANAKVTTLATATTAAREQQQQQQQQHCLGKTRSLAKKRRKQTRVSPTIAAGCPRDPIVNNQRNSNSSDTLAHRLSSQQQRATTKMGPNNRTQASHSMLRGTMLPTVALWAVLLLPQLAHSCRADDIGRLDESFASGKSDNPLAQLWHGDSAPMQQFTSAYPTRGYGDSSDLLYNDPLNTLSSTGANYGPVVGTGVRSGEPAPLAGTVPLQRAPTNKNRRSSDEHDDRDDDDIDDRDDRDDEDQSSSNRVNNEIDPNNPPFGESTQAAKEREDVEKFFDDHLGPTEEMTPQLMAGSEMSASNEAAGRLLADNNNNNSDMETAATSPLSVLSSMLFGRPRPTIITASSGSSLSPVGASSMWSGSSAYDEPSAYQQSAYGGASSGADGAPPTAAHHYSGAPVHAAASNYYNDETMGPPRDMPGSAAGSSYYSGHNRSPYHHHSSIHYSRYPSHGGGSGSDNGADYNSGYNPSPLAQAASETGRYPSAARGKPAALPAHNYHSHYPPHQAPAHHYSHNKYGQSPAAGYQSSRPYGQQQSAYTSMSHDDNFSASGRAPYHQATHRDRYSSMARPAASNAIQYNNPDLHTGQQAYGPAPSPARYPSSAYPYSGRGSPAKYYNQAELYQEPSSAYNNGFTIPNEMRANLISPYTDATTIHGDRALVESLLDYPSSQTTTIATNNNKPAAATKLTNSPTSSQQLLEQQQQQQQQEQLSSGSNDATGATGSAYDTMIVSGKPFDRPLDQINRFNINRDDLLSQLAGGSGQSHADQPQATASQPTISNNNGQQGQQQSQQQQQQQQQRLNDTITSDNNNGQQQNNDESQVKPQRNSSSSNNAALGGPVDKKKYHREEWGLRPRVRREDNDAEDNDDDAGWIDEEDNLDDDDQKQQSSSNLNEQSRDPNRYENEDNDDI